MLEQHIIIHSVHVALFLGGCMLEQHNMHDPWAEIQAQEARDYWRARAEAEALCERYDRALHETQAAVAELAAIFRQLAKEFRNV